MTNDSVFSGLLAHSGREIASALHGMELGPPDSIANLVGAVMSLALTVEQHNRRLAAIEERLGPAVRKSVNAHNLSPSTVDALREQRGAAEQLALVYAGLIEVWRMVRDASPWPPEAALPVCCAAEARLRAMLEAAGKLPPLE